MARPLTVPDAVVRDEDNGPIAATSVCRRRACRVARERTDGRSVGRSVRAARSHGSVRRVGRGTARLDEAIERASLADGDGSDAVGCAGESVDALC